MGQGVYIRGRGCNPLMTSHEIMRCSYSFSHNHGGENGLKGTHRDIPFFCMIMAGTPWKIDMEPEHLLFGNGNHLASPHFLGSVLISSGVTIPTPFAPTFSTPKKMCFFRRSSSHGMLLPLQHKRVHASLPACAFG